MESKKRGVGRPKKLPEGQQHSIKCVLVTGELDRLRSAMEATDMSQRDFTRASVLHAVDTVLGVKPATPGPKRKK